MFPPKGYPTWRDAMAGGYLMSKEANGILRDAPYMVEAQLKDQ